MSNIQNIDISLQEIVKNISKNSYLIPKFQRDFVWTLKDITDLGDSIIRGYPISSLLIMPENGTLKIGAHGLIKDEEPDELKIKIDDSEFKYYILDGQQRMTSIAKLFLAIDNKNEYYFDLLSILNEKFPEDNIQNDSGLKIIDNRNKSSVTDVLCRSFPIGKDKSEKPTRQDNRFISGKNIIDNKFGSVVSKFLRTLRDASEENIDKYTDYLNAVLGAIGGYSIPATVIASDSELGVVIRVFEKVNSTGKKLTLFDLINAKSFQVENKLYQGGLSDFLTKKLNEAAKKCSKRKAGIDNFFKYDENSGTYEKLDKIIRIFEIASLLEKNVTPTILQSAMLSREPEFWFTAYNEKSIPLFDVIDWLEDEGLIDIAQTTFLEYATAIFLANPKALGYSKFKTEVKKYTLYLNLSNISFNKSNLDVVEKIYSISKKITENHVSNKFNYTSPSSSPNLTKERVLEFTTSRAEFKTILHILYNEKVAGNFTQDISGNRIKQIDKSKMDNHHIYPKARVKDFSNKSPFNSIANIILVDNSTNREEIKDRSPDEYFAFIKQQPNGIMSCEKNLIDIDEVIKINSEEEAMLFIENRAEKISQIVNSYFD